MWKGFILGVILSSRFSIWDRFCSSTGKIVRLTSLFFMFCWIVSRFRLLSCPGGLSRGGIGHGASIFRSNRGKLCLTDMQQDRG